MPRRTNPDAVALIKEDHRKVEKLFESFEKARDEERKKALAREIYTELTIHAITASRWGPPVFIEFYTVVTTSIGAARRLPMSFTRLSSS